MRITALERGARRRRFQLYVDGEFTLTVSPDVCLQFRLRTGDAISPEKLEAVREAEDKHVAMTSALRLLSYRRRSEREIRERLMKKGVSADVCESTITRLRETGLIDDEAFARAFVESRNRTSPRSRRMIAVELGARGIQTSIVNETASEVDEADAAYRAAAKRARSLKDAPFPDFRRRIGDFLLRRGFEFEVAAEAAMRLWNETRGEVAGGGGR